jgi:hypothetical protein
MLDRLGLAVEAAALAFAATAAALVHRRVQKIHPCYPGLMRATQGGLARPLRRGHHG